MTSGENDCRRSTHGLSAAGRSGAEGSRPSAAWLSDPEVSSQKLAPVRTAGRHRAILAGPRVIGILPEHRIFEREP